MHSLKLPGFLRAPVTAGLVLFSALLSLTLLITYQHYLLFESTTLREEIGAANLAKERLQIALANSLSATQTLSFIEKKYGIKGDFDTVGRQILASNKYVDGIELLKGGVITHVYPLKENASVIGYNILEDTSRNNEAYKAIAKKTLFFAGPFNLKQGGTAIVGRLPIFKNDKFWGFSVALVKLSTLIDAAGFDTTATCDYLYQLSKINPQTGKEEFFLPTSNAFKKSKAVWVDVPTGEWKIYAMCKDRGIMLSLIPYALLGLLLSITGGLFAYYITRQPIALKKLVDEQSSLLRASEESYRQLIEEMPEAIYTCDAQGRIMLFNKAAEELFGIKLTVGQDILKIVSNLFDQTGKQLATAEYPISISLKEGRQIYAAELRIKRPDGSSRCVLLHTSPLYKGADINGAVNIIVDITQRKNAEEEVARERNVSDAIINSLPGTFYLYDKQGKFLRWNTNFELVSGYTEAEIANMHPLDFFDGGEKGIVMEKIGEVFTTGMAEVEANLLTKRGEKIPYYFNGYASVFEGEDCLIGMGIDITKRRNAEQAIRVSEENYRYLFNNNPALIFVWDPVNMKVLSVNQTALDEYGYTRNEALNMTVLDLRPAEEHERIKHFATVMADINKPTDRNTWRHLKKNGEVMYMDIRSHNIIYNNRPAILSIAENITQKQIIEAELQKSYEDIRLLNTHLQTVREEERAGIAREIHDELGQQLTALKMDVSWIRKKVHTDNAEVFERLTGMVNLIDQTVKVVRRIASDLRPGVLDDLGLIAALEWQLGEFEKRMGIKTSFNANITALEMDKKITIGLFRVYQEALTNIARHAEATQVDIFVEQNEQMFSITIKDNGKGFDLDEIKHRNTLGLIGMTERVRMLNGELIIDSSHGKGTSIFIKAPIQT